MRRWQQSSQQILSFFGAPSVVENTILDLQEKVGTTLFSLSGVTFPTSLCGSSGGVCALLGARLVLVTRDIYRFFHQQQSPGIGIGIGSNQYKYAYQNRNISRSTHIRSIAGSVIDLVVLAQYISSEFLHLYSNSQGAGADNVSHASHVQGAAFGAMLSLTWVLQ